MLQSNALKLWPAFSGGYFTDVITEGAFRYQLKEDIIVVTPLPDIDSFTIEMRIDKLTIAGQRVKSISAVNEDGEKVRSVDFDGAANRVKFKTQSKEFAYHIQIFEG